MKRLPTYLRTVVTTRCNLSCSYCHLEGDPQLGGTPRELPATDLAACLRVAAACGIQKFKFLGGEPLLRTDLPAIVRGLRDASPTADLSVITAGVVPVERLHALLDAGLSRANVSIHGFGPGALAHNIGTPRAHGQRNAFVEAVLATGRPLKLNYVYGSAFDSADLGHLLDWAAPRGLLVNVLDDLNKQLAPRDIANVVRRLRGEPTRIDREPDPHSFETEHWHYSDGLRIEIKDVRLGDVAPFAACGSCPKRARCKEGIFALRLTHDGYLQPCMDRPDLRLPLAHIVRDSGADAAAAAWRQFVESL